MELRISNISYRFDDNGNTQNIQTTISGSENGNYINATIVITKEDLPSGVSSLDDLTRKDIQKAAIAELQKEIAPTSPEESTTK